MTKKFTITGYMSFRMFVLHFFRTQLGLDNDDHNDWVKYPPSINDEIYEFDGKKVRITIEEVEDTK